MNELMKKKFGMHKSIETYACPDCSCGGCSCSGCGCTGNNDATYSTGAPSLSSTGSGLVSQGKQAQSW